MSLDTAALLSAERGTGEALHMTLGTTSGADRAPCSSSSAWATRLAGLPNCLVRDSAKTYKAIVSAPVIRAPVENESPLWLALTVYRFKATAALHAY